MNAELTAVLAKQLARVKKEIAKRGPLTWQAARMAMSPSYDPRDAYQANRQIMEWVKSGQLKSIPLPDGDTKVGM